MGRHTKVWFSKLPEQVVKFKYLFLFISVVIITVAVTGSQRLQFDMSLESFFEASDPVKITYNQFRDAFGGDDSIYIVYEAMDGDVLSDQSIKALQSIHDDIFTATSGLEDDAANILDHLVEINSLYNVSYLEVTDASLNSREFIFGAYPETDEDRELLRKQALAHQDYPLFYISRDSKYAGIHIRTDFGIEQEEITDDTIGPSPANPIFKPADIQDYAMFLKALVSILNKPEHADILKFHPVGNPVIMAFFNDVLNIEMEQFLSIAFLLMFVVLFILFRNFSAVLWSVLIVILSIVTTVGFMGWVGFKMNIMVSILVMLILVIGIADSAHILSGYVFYRKKALDHFETLRLVYQKSGFACFLTSVTTSIGLMSLAFVRIPPIRYFGISAAFGVMAAFLFTMILLPILITIWKPVSQKQITHAKNVTPLIQKFLDKLEPIAKQRSTLIVVFAAVVFIVSGYGLLKVEVDSNLVTLVKEDSPIRIAHNIVDKELGGSQNMDIFIKFETIDALKDPRVLSTMAVFQKQIIQEYPEFVTRTNSLVDVVKNTFQVLNKNKKEMYIIPQQKDLLSQTLLIFENSNYDDRKLLVSDDYRNARINIRLKNYGSMAYLDFFEATQKKLEELFNPLKSDYPGLNVEVTGGLALMMRVVDYMSWAQIQSFGLTLLIITLMLLFVFGHPKFGLIGMIPNLIPVMITFGVMGIFKIPLDGDTLIIAPIVIGIAVDDTIHFLTHYRLEIVATKGNISEAIRLSIKEAGQAITFSTLILIIGFLVLMFSDHQGLANFGFLSLIAFTSALLSDLLLLPALCHLFKLRSGK